MWNRFYILNKFTKCMWFSSDNFSIFWGLNLLYVQKLCIENHRTSISGYCLWYIQFITFLFHLYNTGSSLVLKRKGTHVSILHKEEKQVKTKPHPFICLRIQNVIFMSIIFFTHILKKHVLPVSAENTGYQSIDINSQQLQSL